MGRSTNLALRTDYCPSGNSQLVVLPAFLSGNFQPGKSQPNYRECLAGDKF